MEPAGHCLIKGVAGSGKTTVAVHRIPYLMDHYCYEKEDQILLVTFNKTLLNHMKYLYDKVENPESQPGMAEIMNQEVKVEIKTITGGGKRFKERSTIFCGCKSTGGVLRGSNIKAVGF